MVVGVRVKETVKEVKRVKKNIRRVNVTWTNSHPTQSLIFVTTPRPTPLSSKHTLWSSSCQTSMAPRTRRQHTAVKVGSAAATTDTSTHVVSSKNKGRGAKTHPKLPRLVIKRPHGPVATSEGKPVCYHINSK